MPSIKTQIKPWLFCILYFVKYVKLPPDNCLLRINKVTPRGPRIEAVMNVEEFAPYYLTEMSVMSKQSQLILVISVSNVTVALSSIFSINMAINHPDGKNAVWCLIIINTVEEIISQERCLTVINFCWSRRRAMVNYPDQSRAEQFWQGGDLFIIRECNESRMCTFYQKKIKSYRENDLFLLFSSFGDSVKKKQKRAPKKRTEKRLKTQKSTFSKILQD